jgi:non-canonical purine NTP pyrophosphatase (RdgB/HAM1 family)
MQELLFASSNKAKLQQFQFVADAYGFQVKITSVYAKYPKLQTYDEEYDTHYEIVDKGAREIYRQIKQPILVEDTILEVDALDGLPGLHANDYLKTRGQAGLLKQLQGQTKRSAGITSIVGYYDGHRLVSSKNIVEGSIARKESFKAGEPDWVGPTNHPLGGGFNAVFIIKATGKTLADHTAKEGLTYGYRESNFKVLLDLLCRG